MRLLPAVLFVALTGSIGFAEETAPPPPPSDEAKPAEAKPEAHRGIRAKVPLRVVKLLPETRQVLLFDKNKGTHVVAEVGQDVAGYLVDDIGEDEVTLVAANGTEVILAAPEPTWRRRAAAPKTAAAATVPAKAEPSPEDPYGDAAPPAAPGDDGVRVASAAPDVDPGVAAFMAAVSGEDIGEDGNPTAAPAPVKPADAKATNAGSSLAAAMTGSPASTSPTIPTAATNVTVAGPTTATIKRTEINAALADFSTTASTFHASFTKDGLRFDDVVKGSLLARAGLERGDVVTTVDGQPLRSLDDAANLYARLPTARGTTLVVLRSGKPVTLRVSIQ